MNEIEVFKQIYELKKKADAWLDNVPSDIRFTFFDNEYVNTFYEMNTLLIDAYFGEHTQSIEWFLYDWRPGFKCFPDANHPGIPINSIDEYITYMKEYEGFTKDNE